MGYLLKSSAIIVLFYMCYKLFLQRETFFVGNRWFLLFGLLLSVVIPIISIPIYVEHVSLPVEFIVSNENSQVSTIPIESSFNYFQLIPWIYFAGLVFFIGKLGLAFFSLFRLKKNHSYYKKNSFTYIETTNDFAPFSFFRWIFFNSNQFNEQELDLILKHERIHGSQGHSVDVLCAQIICALLWFNPFVWFYKSAIQQNLEFIADNATQTNLDCEKSYQNLLLRTSISNKNLSITSTFYNSLIKKRILMLHKSKSKKMNAYKFAIVLPLLVLFVFNFNTEVIAQAKEAASESSKIGQNVLKYVITKNTKDTQLESIKENLAKSNVIVEFKNLKRNDRKEITGIKINYESNAHKGNYSVNSENPIDDIEIAFNVNENKLMVGQAKKSLSQSFDIIKENGKVELKKESTESDVIVHSTDDNNQMNNTIKVVGKDGQTYEVTKAKKTYIIKSNDTKISTQNDDSPYIKKSKNDTIWIKSDVKNIIWTNDDGEEIEIMATQREKNNVRIFASENENPLILLNGKEITKREMHTLNPEDIETVNVIKGEKAIKAYGQKAKDGVIDIHLKKK